MLKKASGKQCLSSACLHFNTREDPGRGGAILDNYTPGLKETLLVCAVSFLCAVDSNISTDGRYPAQAFVKWKKKRFGHLASCVHPGDLRENPFVRVGYRSDLQNALAHALSDSAYCSSLIPGGLTLATHVLCSPPPQGR